MLNIRINDKMHFMDSGKFYIVATPIGNLDDITVRALKVLSDAEYIACEDTRRTGGLLKALNISNGAMLISYYGHKEKERIPNIINLLKNGKDVVLVSDSGTPLISDPGYPLVRECFKEKIEVISIPGPTAAVSALVSSGQPPDKFIFLGFLPKKAGNRTRLLEETKKSNENLNSTIVFYVAPHKLELTLNEIKHIFGDIKISVAKELTKIHEEVLFDKITNLQENEKIKSPKGEFVILMNPKTY